ncbi:MAG TPA: PEGA domain-containing protein [Polyangiaceae bacterium]|jgi:tetratricopeptide (TPR) repeat protein|nr:PEGA domain-containing protein [Polyangiaceae bacterium]
MKRRDGARRARALCVLVVLGQGVAAATASVALADGTTPLSPRAEAKQRYEAGVAAYEAKRYSDAIDSFLEADRISPSAVLSFDIARAYEKLDDVPNALLWYRDFLRRTTNPSDQAQANRAIASLEARLHEEKQVGHAAISSSPPGAEVTIDGRSMGNTPWSGDLDPGSHNVSVHLPGYIDAARDFGVTANGQTELELRMTEMEAAAPEPVTSLPTTPAPVSEPHRSPLPTIGFVTMGAGGAALGGALIFELLRRSAQSQAKKDENGTQVAFVDDYNQMQARQTAARVFVGVGGALVLAGGVMVFIGAKHNSEIPTTQVSFGCSPTICGGTLGRRF